MVKATIGSINMQEVRKLAEAKTTKQIMRVLVDGAQRQGEKL